MKGIISDHGIEGIENIGNLERPRAMAAFVLLGELLLAYSLSSLLIPALPGAAGDSETVVRSVSIGPPLLSPLQESEPSPAPEAPPPDSDNVTPGASSKPEVNSAPAFEAGDEVGVTGTGTADDVRIVSISPEPTMGLFTGDLTTFVVMVEYNLASADSGNLKLAIEECFLRSPNAGPIPLGGGETDERELTRFSESKSVTVPKGRRRVTLSHTVRIPAPCTGARLEVSTILKGNGITSSPSNDHRPYRVADNGGPPSGTQSTVHIVSIEPDTRNALRIGDKVDFYVVVEYNLISPLGTIHFSLENGGSGPLHTEPARVNKGRRRITFHTRLAIPAIGAASPQGLTVKTQLEETMPHQTIVDGVKRVTMTPGQTDTDSKKYMLVTRSGR